MSQDITAIELLELEMLFIEDCENESFDPIPHNESKDLVLITNRKLKRLIDYALLLNYRANKKGDYIVNYYLFRILQLRYFRGNKSVSFIKDETFQ